jgi:uridylate kinase
LRAVKHLEKGYIVVFAAGIGQPFVTTDYPAVQRAIEIRAEAIFAAKQGANGVYDSDPRTNPHARRYAQVTYEDVIANEIKLMDQSAFILARDHQLPIHAFDASTPNAMRDIVLGKEVGTYVGPDATTQFAVDKQEEAVTAGSAG